MKQRMSADFFRRLGEKQSILIVFLFLYAIASQARVVDILQLDGTKWKEVCTGSLDCSTELAFTHEKMIFTFYEWSYDKEKTIEKRESSSPFYLTSYFPRKYDASKVGKPSAGRYIAFNRGDEWDHYEILEFKDSTLVLLYELDPGGYVGGCTSTIYGPNTSLRKFVRITDSSSHIVKMDGINYHLNNNKKTVHVDGYFSDRFVREKEVYLLDGFNFLGQQYNVSNISDSAFFRFESATSVFVPNTVRKIGKFAFCMCTNMKTVVLPISVSCLETGTFWGCASLTEITIPSSVTELKSLVFGECGALHQIICKGKSVPRISSDTFSGFDVRQCVLIVPRGCGDLYHHADGWKTFKEIREQD